MTAANIHARANPRNEFIVARGRLAEAKRWFAHRGWSALPESDRGRSIIRWGADHAYLAASSNDPKRSARNWCRRWAPWLSDVELARLLAGMADSNKRWSHDQSAAVLEIAVRDRVFHGFRFIGAEDDPDHEIRIELKRLKAAARSRRYRAGKSTGRKRGRPALQLSSGEKLVRSNAQAVERMKRYRLRKNASRHISNIDSVTELSVTDSRAPQAPERLAPLVP